MRVEEVAFVGARRVITLRVPFEEVPTGILGAIVRLEPTAGATAEQLASVATELASIAARVVILPIRAGDVLPADVVAARREARVAGPRKVVEQLVEESNSVDKERLRSVVETILEEVGL